MSIVYRCPVCSETHRSRLQASRPSSFRDVVSQLADVLEICPSTGDWTALTFADMSWQGDTTAASGTAR